MTPTLRKAAVFTALAFGISWAAFLTLTPIFNGPGGATIVYVVFMFGPLAAGILTALIFDRGHVLATLALGVRFNAWWLLAVVAPLLLCWLALLVTLGFPGVAGVSFAEGMVAAAVRQGLDVPPDLMSTAPPIYLLAPAVAVVGGAINMVFAIGEEAGWRGYLWTTLRPLGFWRATLWTGLAWGLWHLPVIVAGHNYGLTYWGYPYVGVAMMVLFTLGLSPILGLIRDKTGSVWAAALFHGSLNAVAGIFLLSQSGAGPLLNGITGLAGALVLMVSAAFVATYLHYEGRQRPNPVAE